MEQSFVHEVDFREPPNEALIATLRKILEEAEAGEIQAMAYTMLWRCGATGSGYSVPTVGQAVRVMGEMEWLKYRILLADGEVRADIREKVLDED